MDKNLIVDTKNPKLEELLKIKYVQFAFTSSSIMSAMLSPYCWSIRLSNSFNIRLPKAVKESKHRQNIENNKKGFFN